MTVSAENVAITMLVIGFASPTTYAQNRVDLEDLSVKGEILRDNRIPVTSRETMHIRDRIQYRKNFRLEITEEQELRMPVEDLSIPIEAVTQ